MTRRIGAGIVVAIAVAASAGSTMAQTGQRSGQGYGLPYARVLPQVRTLQEALVLAYSYSPTLTAARAGVRATDENVPVALAGWRPQVVFSGVAGYATGHLNPVPNVAGGGFVSQAQTGTGIANTGNNGVAGGPLERREYQASLTLTQPVYRGGRTKAQTNQAINRVLAARAQLLASENTVFTNVVSSFVNVIAAQQVADLDRTNEQVLTKQLQATTDRFTVGETTRTDVAQAEAALAQATATRQTAEGQVQTARGTFEQYVGVLPGKLVEPQPLKLPARSEEQASAIAAHNNPNVVAALFTDAEAKDTFDLAYSQLMPNVNLQASAFYDHDVAQRFLREQGGTVLANVSIPIYQGGSEYAAIRQARQQEQQTHDQVDDARRTAVQQAVSAWETYTASKGTITSDQAAIQANQIALEGIEREALVGSRTTLDVLTAQETLLQSRVALVQTLANYVNASYDVAAAVGRLTARDLNLPVPLYDDTAYYNAVKDRWIGTGDFATDQPGR